MSERIIDTIKRVDIENCLDAFDNYSTYAKPMFVKLQRMKSLSLGISNFILFILSIHSLS